MRRNLALLPALLALLLVSACATGSNSGASGSSANPLTPVQRLYQTYGNALETAATVHRETMVAVGEARARGLIDDAQLEKARSVGKQVESALRLAQTALSVYLQNPTSAAGETLSQKFLEVEKILATLTETIEKMGVK